MESLAFGKCVWTIGDPPTESHIAEGLNAHPSTDTVSILNSGHNRATVRIWVNFSEANSLGPFHETVGAGRARHLKFSFITGPADRGFFPTYTVASNVPIICTAGGKIQRTIRVQ